VTQGGGHRKRSGRENGKDQGDGAEAAGHGGLLRVRRVAMKRTLGKASASPNSIAMNCAAWRMGCRQGRPVVQAGLICAASRRLAHQTFITATERTLR
jgi:hypothetical protein